MEDLEAYKQANREFKSYIEARKMLYQTECRRELIQTRNDPKRCWGLLKKQMNTSNTSKSSYSSCSDWYNYFFLLLSNALDNLDSLSGENVNEYSDNDILKMKYYMPLTN
jgi:hypothetical protein